MQPVPSPYRYPPQFGVAAFVILACLGGCASRPTAAVLTPETVGRIETKDVTLLAVTNRKPDPKDGGYTGTRADGLTYERYGFSIPPKREGAAIAYPAKVPDPRRQFIVTARQKLSREALIADATRSAHFDGTVAVFVHGYNYSYQEALYRTAQMAADAGTLSPPIMFSWPSAASVTGYVADRDAALYSRTELESLLTGLARTPRVTRVVLFGHSLGGFLSMEAVRQLKLQGRTDVIGRLQVVLAAPDIDVDVFRSQLNDIGPMTIPITVLVSKTDRALAVSSVIGGERPRIGRLDINDPVIAQEARKAHVSVVDISDINSSDGLGHDRYAALAKFGGKLVQTEASTKQVGSFVFDAGGAEIAAPFRLTDYVVKQ